eukprot:GHUV01019174.1.p1 GENE.GHUV01019174.1~~GHUV01019174.1.p1  ORF type:complete len:618 (+),score=279.54 GHUV01019174.1:256-2109(+)
MGCLQGEQCELGAACPHSHHVFESWLHPQKFRTMLCKDGDSCNREVCFFAHGQEQLRVPTRDMALRGPSRPRHDGGHQQQPWTSAAVSAAAAASNCSAATGPGPAAKANGGDISATSVSVMPIMGSKNTPFSWCASPDRQLSSSVALQPQLDPLSSSNMISGSSSSMSAASAMSTDMSQLLNCMLQQNGNGRSGSLPDPSGDAGGFMGRLASSQQDSGSMLSGDLAALLLQQQLAQNAAVSQARLQQQMGSAWGGAPADQDLEQLKLSILQQMQGQLDLQDAMGWAQQARQPQDNPTVSSTSNMLAQSASNAATAGVGSNMRLEQLQTAMSGVGIQPGLDLAGTDFGPQGAHSGPCLVPSISNLGPGTTAAGSAELMEWLQLQQLAAGVTASTGVLLLQQQQVAAQAAALQQLQGSAGLGFQSTDCTTGQSANPLFYGASSKGNSAAAAAASASAAGMLLGLRTQAAAGAGLNRMNSGVEQQRQQQLASDYLLQLQRNTSGGLGFHSAPEAALLAARSRSSSAFGVAPAAAASGRMSFDAATGYAALLGGDSRAVDNVPGPNMVSFDERPMYHSANAALWGTPEDLHSTGSHLANTVDATFPVGYTAAGGSKQLGWL